MIAFDVIVVGFFFVFVTGFFKVKVGATTVTLTKDDDAEDFFVLTDVRAGTILVEPETFFALLVKVVVEYSTMAVFKVKVVGMYTLVMET